MTPIKATEKIYPKSNQLTDQPTNLLIEAVLVRGRLFYVPCGE